MEDRTDTVHLENRKKLSLNGVLEVVCFLEDRAELILEGGRLQITGIGLHMERLDLEKGEIFVTGRVDSLYFPDGNEREKKGFFAKLFS